MSKLNEFKEMAIGLMDISYGVNRLEEAKKGLKESLLIAIISNLILAAICVGIMYLRFRVF